MDKDKDWSKLSYESVRDAYLKETRIQDRLKQISGGGTSISNSSNRSKTAATARRDEYREVSSSDRDADRRKEHNKYNFSASSGSHSVSHRKDQSNRNATGGVVTITFKEVVEKFAEEHAVEFHPLSAYDSQRIISSSSASSNSREGPEGKQLYVFGGVPCYIDHNVLFIRQDKSKDSSHKHRDWLPIDLQELLNKVQ